MGAGGKKKVWPCVIKSEVENRVILQPKGGEIPNRSLSMSFGTTGVFVNMFEGHWGENV